MCGISGVLRFDGAPVNREELYRLTRSLAHRGPDDEGYEYFGVAAFGHRRLSIIDLGTGHEPLSNEDGTVWLTFNGEIYNFRELRRELEAKSHRFRTRTDAEVIVHGYEEWGEACVTKLEGMFAFGLWDARRQRLLLVRDRVGIKPLVYWQRADSVYFASELQAFQALESPPNDIDLRALDYFLELLYVPAPHTIFSGVRKLPAGHTLTVDRDGAARLSRYWKPEFSSEGGRSEAEWIDRMDAAVQEAVRSHLVADVPVGAFLSSGLDSSLVASLMARESVDPIRTFTIRIDEPGYDESEGARDLAGALGSRHSESPLDDGDVDVPAMLARYGEPFADPSILPTFAVSRLASRDVKVVLSGDGGDEVFGGYPWLTGALEAFVLPTGDPRVIARRAVRRVLGWFPGSGRIADPLRILDENLSCFDSTARRGLWRPEWRSRVGRPSVLDQSRKSLAGLDLCSQIQLLDLEWDLPGDILTKVDIASMTFGLEVRVPLLDHRLVELALSLPLGLKYQREDNKTISRIAERRVAERHITGASLTAPKRGFGIPLRRWWSFERQRDVVERIVGGRSPLLEYLDPSQLRRLTAELRPPEDDLKAWAIGALETWLSADRRLASGRTEPRDVEVQGV